MPLMATSKPDLARWVAQARPMPRLPPVTKTVGLKILDFALAATDEDRVGHDDFFGSAADVALFDNGVNRPEKVQICSRASGDAVHDGADFVSLNNFWSRGVNC